MLFCSVIFFVSMRICSNNYFLCLVSTKIFRCSTKNQFHLFLNLVLCILYFPFKYRWYGLDVFLEDHSGPQLLYGNTLKFNKYITDQTLSVDQELHGDTFCKVQLFWVHIFCTGFKFSNVLSTSEQQKMSEIQRFALKIGL